jgi:uncharacterized protein YyaL (SSP411 family)
VPAANSLAANGLLRLAALTGDAAYETPAVELIRALGPLLREHPSAFAYLLGAVERLVTPPLEVAIVTPGPGDAPGDGGAALRREVYGRLLPAAVAVTAPAGVGADLTPLLAQRTVVDGTATAYVCERYACRRPVTAPEELRAELDAALAARRTP